MRLSVDTHREQLKLRQVARACPDISFQSVIRDHAAATPYAVSTEHRTPVDRDSVLLFQMGLRNDDDINLITGQMLDSVRLGNGRSVQDVQYSEGTLS